MDELVARAGRIALRLKDRKETVAVWRSPRPAGLLPRRCLAGATWGVGETGAAGPAGNRYGDPAGHAWLAVAGPRETAIRLSTGTSERFANMQLFAAAALRLFEEALG